jgi:hypothetical protein
MDLLGQTVDRKSARQVRLTTQLAQGQPLDSHYEHYVVSSKYETQDEAIVDAMEHVTHDMAHESAGGEGAVEMQPCFDIVCIAYNEPAGCQRIPGKPDQLTPI